MQAFLMLVIAIACLWSAALWIADGQIASAIAFGGFGVGYIGLTVLFWP